MQYLLDAVGTAADRPHWMRAGAVSRPGRGRDACGSRAGRGGRGQCVVRRGRAEDDRGHDGLEDHVHVAEFGVDAAAVGTLVQVPGDLGLGTPGGAAAWRAAGASPTTGTATPSTRSSPPAGRLTEALRLVDELTR